ncbi:PREDICTED: uncharacterized protein LOC105461764 [Wasmannia auropunctata]|uniref:uncharacterized protein LOC105461764 n=1 Tax=Wasmannia auropunctata TaxID=64793 RepID=UPI0005EF7BF3|nr:PREDICTED: uncharacterized protein LOC105461764 [Wasmannia auropunctata]
MAYFRSRFQIIGLFSLNKNKYNLFSWQQSWHHAKSSVCLKKNINEDCNKKLISTLSKRPECYGLKKKICIRKASSTQKKRIVKRKLSLWQYVFGPKKSSENPSTSQLPNSQEQTSCKDLRCKRSTDKPVYTDLNKLSKDSKRFTEPQPKPPPPYKLPRAVLLSRAMVEGFSKKGDACEGKKVIPTTPRKPYEEMKPASSIKRIEHRKNVRLEDIKYDKSTFRKSLTSTEARDATAKILRQAMAQEEPRMHSKSEQLKILLIVDEKMTKSPPCASRIDSERKNSGQ